MASTSISTLVIFIAAVSIAAGVSGVMVSTVGGISASLDDRGAAVAQSIDTEIEIISDPGSDAIVRDYEGDSDGDTELVLLVKNTGDRTIPTAGSAVEVLVDGQYVSPGEYSVETVGSGAWTDGDVVRIVIDRSLAAGDHRATVIAGSDRETLRFRT
jgi:flagellar protein FlaG